MSSEEPVKGAPLGPICRCCASASEGLVQIFSSEGIQRGLPEKVARCLPILISETDDLPSTICMDCSEKLEAVRSFFESCFTSNKSLLLRLRESKRGSKADDRDLESHLNLYVRHFSTGPSTSSTPSSIKSEPIRDEEFIEEDLEDEEYVEEEEEEDEEMEDELDEDEDFDEINEHDPLSLDSSFNNSVDGEFKVPQSHSTSSRRRVDKSQKGPSSYDPYFDDLDIDLCAPSPGSKSSRKRGRKPQVSLSLRTCADCGEEFKNQASNLNHWKESHPDKEAYYKCTQKGCDFQSKQTDEMNKHRFRHGDKSKLAARSLSTCSVCGKRYPSNFLLTRHMSIHTDTTRNQNCPICNKLYPNDKELSDHVKIHGSEDIKYSHCCHYCGKRFTQRANLEGHLRVHSGFKPFSCDFCGKNFSQKGNMEEHRRTHTGEKPYVCELCGFAFARRSELQLHNRCVHTGERPYQCAYCPKNFQRRDLLRKHERIHTDTRPYACEYCAKTFTQRDKMVVHTRLHTGERPYVCEVCGKGFCESGNLKKHLRVHGKEIPKIMHQNNKGKPPPIHPSAFVPTKSEHAFHRHSFPSPSPISEDPPGNNNHNNPTTESNSSSSSVNNNQSSHLPSPESASLLDNHRSESAQQVMPAANHLMNSGLRIPSSTGNVHAASIAAAAAAAMTQKPMDYAFPAVAAAMMQQQQQQQQHQPGQQMHLEDSSDSASERSITPSFIQSHVQGGTPHHHAQGPQTTPGLPHYAMHGLIQHLSDWSAVYGGHHQLSGHGPANGGGGGNHGGNL